MSETQETDGDAAEQNDDGVAEQLKRLALDGDEEVSKPSQHTPTLDYLQVPTINGNIAGFTTRFICARLLFRSFSLKNCTTSTGSRWKTKPKTYHTTEKHSMRRSKK